jgi:hypothetical protein
LPTFVSTSTSSIPSGISPSSRIAGPERQGVPDPVGEEFVRGRRGLVVDPDGAVAVERQALPRALVPVDDAVADDDAVVPEAVVVAVDGEDRVVVGGDRRGVLDDVGAEAVLRERRLQDRGVGEGHVGDVVGDGAVPASGHDGGQLHRGALGVVRAARHFVAGGERRGVGAGGLRRFVGVDVGDLDVVDDEALQRPHRSTPGRDGQGGGAGDEGTADPARWPLGRRHADVCRDAAWG